METGIENYCKRTCGFHGYGFEKGYLPVLPADEEKQMKNALDHTTLLNR